MSSPSSPRADRQPTAGVTDDPLAQAEEAVAQLATRFREVFRADVTEARALLADAAATPEAEARHLARIFTICHDIKGQGATFGSVLLTRIAALACDALRGRSTLGAGDGAVLDAHLAALQFIIDRGIVGDGGEMGAALLAKLARHRGSGRAAS